MALYDPYGPTLSNTVGSLSGVAVPGRILPRPGVPAFPHTIQDELPRDETGGWSLHNLVGSFVNGIRQGVLLDNVLFDDPEINAATDVPVARILGMLGGAIGEGMLTQSWILRGLGALAEAPKLGRVAQVAKVALDDYLVGEEIDYVRKIAGHAALGVASEGLLNVAAGHDLGQTATNMALAGAGGAAFGALGFGANLAKGTSRGLGEVTRDADEALSGLGAWWQKARGTVNENLRYEHAVRTEKGFVNSDLSTREWNLSHEFGLLDKKKAAAFRGVVQAMRKTIAEPIFSLKEKDEAWKHFSDLADAFQERSLARAGVKTVDDLAGLEDRFQGLLKTAPQEVRYAFEAHKAMLKDVADQARTYMKGFAEQTDLFEMSADEADDALAMAYAHVISDVEQFSAGPVGHKIQFLRRGGFISREDSTKLQQQDYFSRMGRALTKAREGALVDQFVESVEKHHGLTADDFTRAFGPEAVMELERKGRWTAPDGTAYARFNLTAAKILPEEAVSRLGVDIINGIQRGTLDPKILEELDIKPIWAIETPKSFILKQNVHDAVTKKIQGRDIFAEKDVFSPIRNLTAKWKINTIWWGLSRFAVFQVIGDSVSAFREHGGKIFLNRNAEGKLQSYAYRALKEIFDYHRTPIWSEAQMRQSLGGAAAGAVVGGVLDEDHFAGAAGGALAGAGLGYARATFHAAGSLERILQDAKIAASTGMPADFSVHVPPMPRSMAEALAGTKVVDVATGKPRIVFHGTASVFDEFDDEFLNPDDWAKGHFFTEDPHVASGYASNGSYDIPSTPESEALYARLQQLRSTYNAFDLKTGDPEELWQIGDEIKQVKRQLEELRTTAPNVRMVRLNIQNPLDLDAPADPNLVETILKRYLGEDEGYAFEHYLKEMPVISGLRNQDIHDAYVRVRGIEDAQEMWTGQGFDGLTHIGGKASDQEHRVWIAFSKAQIHDAFEAPLSERPLMETLWREQELSSWKARMGPRPGDYYRAADRLGVVNSGMVAGELDLAHQVVGKDVGSVLGHGGTGRTTLDTALSLVSGRVHGNPADWAHNWLRGVEVVQEERENVLRLASFMLNLEEGVHPKVAARRAAEGLVDYTRFTDFENKYLRGFLLPFYSFTRHNTANWMRALGGVTHLADGTKLEGLVPRWDGAVGGRPKVALAATAALGGVDVAAQAWNQMFFGDVENNLEDWQRNKFHIIMGNPLTGEAFTDARGRPMVMSTEMGYETTLEMMGLARPAKVLNLFGAGLPDQQSMFDRMMLLDDAEKDPWIRRSLGGFSNEVARLLTPAFKLPLELTGNRSWMFDAPIVPEEYRGTHEEWDFRLKYIAQQAFRQYREGGHIMGDVGDGDWSPWNSALGLGLPIQGVDMDASIRRRLHDQMEAATLDTQKEKAPWKKAIDDLIYSRPRWDQPQPGEQMRLQEILAEDVPSPEVYEEAIRYYSERTYKSSVLRHWNTLRAKDRAKFVQKLSPGDRASLIFYLNGGGKIDKYLEPTPEEMQRLQPAAAAQ